MALLAFTCGTPASTDSSLTFEDRVFDDEDDAGSRSSTVAAASAPSGREAPTGVAEMAFAGNSAI